MHGVRIGDPLRVAQDEDACRAPGPARRSTRRGGARGGSEHPSPFIRSGAATGRKARANRVVDSADRAMARSPVPPRWQPLARARRAARPLCRGRRAPRRVDMRLLGGLEPRRAPAGALLSVRGHRPRALPHGGRARRGAPRDARRRRRARPPRDPSARCRWPSCVRARCCRSAAAAASTRRGRSAAAPSSARTPKAPYGARGRAPARRGQRHRPAHRGSLGPVRPARPAPASAHEVAG